MPLLGWGNVPLPLTPKRGSVSHFIEVFAPEILRGICSAL